MGVGVTGIEVELVERLVEHVPSIEMALLTATGSEATFHALRLARAATERGRVLKFQGCYHGWHDAVAMNVISPADRVGAADPLSTGMMPETVAATAVVPFNDLQSTERVLAEGDVAAVILEPIPHNIGAVLPDDGFLAGLRKLCDRYGTLLVFDEVITGFRHAVGGFQSICGVTPDLTTLGKAMGNGYPIGAVGGRADLMEQFSTTPGRPVFFAGTYNGHPACAAAAAATIDKLIAEPVHEHVFALGERARAELADLFRSLDQPARVSGYGSVFVTYFMDGPVRDYGDLLANDADLFTSMRLAEMQYGVFELPLNLKRSHFSYAHTEDDVDALLDATEVAWQDLKRS
jgi:glutamate-1-semialdehyde 2,1-aminomutase